MDYSFYTTEDFVADEYFIQWVKHPTEESQSFWNAWISKHSEQERLIIKARQIVLMLDFKEVKPPEDKFLEIWQKINEQDLQRINPLAPVKGETPKRYRWYMFAAACILVTVSAITYGIYNWQNTIVINTKFGESHSLMLPDSTRVILNANSSFRYNKNFESNREVWLKGEAFFIVKHKNDNRNFRVHTDDVLVEALGTRFNVNSRRGKSQVVVEEGRVKLDLQNQPINTAPVIMVRGDFAEASKDLNRIVRKVVEVDTYSSWRMNKLVFVNKPLKEIAQLLEDNYGYHITFKKERLGDLRFTGSASADDLVELLQKLAVAPLENIDTTGLPSREKLNIEGADNTN